MTQTLLAPPVETTPAATARDPGPASPLASPESLPTVRLAGVDLHAVTERQVVRTVIDALDAGRGGVVITPNLDHLYRCQGNLTFAALVAEADLVVPDGMPLVWASKIKGTPLPERVAGSNLISSISAAAASEGRRLFLLGGDPGAAEGAARVLRERHPTIQIAGTHCPPKGFEYDSAQMALIVDKLREGRPDIIFVALGSPKQEHLIHAIRRSFPGAWWLGVGISFSFLTGQVRRAPKWMQDNGMEWMHRLYQEPKKLLRRYLVVGLPFAAKLAIRSASERAMAAVGYARPELPAKKASTGTSLPAPSAPPAPRPAAGWDDLNAVAGPTAPAVVTRGDATAILGRLRGLILLGGRVRPTSFSLGVLRPTLELPVVADARLIDHWLAGAEDVARLAGLEWLPTCVTVSDEADAPMAETPPGVSRRPAGAFSVLRDGGEYRGTGGVLRDLAAAQNFSDDDYLLVCNAGQLMLDSLAVVAKALAHQGADVAVVAHDDGTPSGVTLLRVAALRHVAPVGYVDFKEQALPKISAAGLSVAAVRCRRPTAASIRSMGAYIAALRQHHEKLAGRGRGAEPDPLAEDFDRRFSLVENGAEVDGSARVHDSVVLRGSRVEPGAVLVRSVVCEGAFVRRGARHVDALVTMPETATGRGRRLLRVGAR